MARPPAPSPAARNRAEGEDLASRLPPLLMEADRLANSVMAGIHGRRRAGAGETFWQYRTYMPGDSATVIDWRQSGRSLDRLFVRQFEWETASTVWIGADTSPGMNYAGSVDLPAKGDRAAVLAIALASLLTRAGERAGLIGSGLPPFMGRHAPARFAEALITPREAGALDDAPAQGPGRAVWFSDFFVPEETLARQAATLAARQVSGILVQITDPSEEQFPFTGRTEFLDPAEGAPLLIGNAAAQARHYRQAIAGHRQWLSDLAAHHGWTTIHHSTGEPPLTALSGLYAALQRPTEGRAA